MNKPSFHYKLPALQKGDKVRILCTARSAQKSDLINAEAFLESIGLKVDYGDTIGKVHHQFGGTAQERLNDFLKAWNDPEVAAIWVARGGYGSIQVLEGLDFALMAVASLKPVIGYSDVTLIHNKMQKAGLPSIHAFMPLEVGTRSAFAKASLEKALFNEKITVEIENSRALTPQTIKGKLYGGNLSILYSMLGSEDLPDFAGGILFIEEIDEYLYHIERIMYSLKRAGKFNGLKALLVGGMTDMNDHQIPFGKSAHEIIQDLTADFNFPVIFGFPAGHVENNVTLKMGIELEIEILEKQIIVKQ